MLYLLALAACAPVASVALPCSLTNDVAGQDQFQSVNMAYIQCKKLAGIDQTALCTCSSNQLASVQECNYPWINPWISTVFRDKSKFCGAAIAGSSASSLSGSDQSSPSIGGSSTQSSTQSGSSGSSNQQLTTPQKLFFVMIAVCLCLCICGAGGAFYAMNMKKKRKQPKRDYNEEDDYEQQQDDQGYADDQQQYDQQQYDQQQYDQGYAGDMAASPQDGRWDAVASPIVE